MKHIKTIISILVIVVLSYPVIAGQTVKTASLTQELYQYLEKYGSQIVPDEMGYVNYVEMDEVLKKHEPANLDSFYLFPGWPIIVTGSCYEGGIYCNMDADPDPEIVYGIGYTVQAWNIDGSSVPGWPQSITYPATGSPAYGDIDSDDEPEIVVGCRSGTSNGKIYAFELDGSLCSGFPINHGYSSRSPVLADLDGDDVLEIITNKRLYPVGEVWVYRGDGSVFPGWPQPISHVPASSAGVGDITGDGVPEIAGESYDGLYVWDINGNLLPGFPFMMPFGAVNSYSSPVLADLDDDGIREIIFGTHVLGGGGYVFVLENDGTQYPGWPKYTNYWIYGPPAVGYIDDDDILDIAVGDQVLSPSPINKLYAWNSSGNNLPGFPISNQAAINIQVVIGDLDGDNMMELMIDDNRSYTGGIGKYHCYNHDATPVPGWPLVINGSSFFHMPCWSDMDGDGFLDIICAGGVSSTANIYLAGTDVLYNPANIVNPIWQYNVRHDGLYPGETAPPELEVTLTPINPPIVIPANGGTFEYSVNIENMGTGGAVFDAWIEADIPGGTTVSPIVLRPGLNLGAGGVLFREMAQFVPAGAPAGNYTYRLAVGMYPNTIYDADEFDFSKEGELGENDD